MQIKRRGLMLVLSSPSGAGKTTLSRRLLESDSNVTMSISATTRAKRPSEVDGRDYFFIDDEKFQLMVKAGEFLEHAQVFGHHYGTPKQPVLEALAAGRDVLFDIDWQGTQQLRQQVREDVVTIFVLPPSRDELERRLRARAQDSAEVVMRRMAKANDELSHWAEYDYVIVNDDIVRAQTHVETILAAERLKRARQPGIPEFVEGLMREA
ncbi:MAG: guanylate kinase [Alphaproteobacteria bacterium]|nr:guanylate kinase [Alphaproteobacteria bacterium]MDE1987598.1 guanylate kinase [Alphaproteobacteria bacterium]MDE2162830.1 guanylate kinase [Alphaproteobacteria bacterium]MDE2265204.1 guanylate kinase [Alphaproteobacteria bacterium]MDE2499241.1 guanylate kinase [Alphaproteobacteria bacterium]